MAYIGGMTLNREFRSVDERFGLRLGDEIEARIRYKPDLVVCDIACGTEATAISDLTALHPHLRGIGLDYRLLEEVQTERLRLARGDLFAIPFESVADITYCAFVLADITSWDSEEHKQKIAQAVFQITKTLVPKGIAFIDEGSFTGRQYYLDTLIEEIERQSPGYSKGFQTTNNPDLGLIGNYIIVNRLK